MTISRKPQRFAQVKSSAPVDVTAIIQRGGSVAATGDVLANEEKQRKGVLIKLYAETLDGIAGALKTRPVKTSRQTWIEEAIHEKLAREAEE